MAGNTCRPVKGSNTFDVLAAALEEIHSEYKIREKVTRTTTDSGSNFLKAFRLYGEKKEEEATNVQEDSDSTLDDATENQSESEVAYQDVSAILDDNSGLEYQLPRHQKCACHLLNLVSTVDATAAGGGANETYKRLSQSAFAKCQALWNKTSRSTMAHETVERECKLQFLRPNQTRWSSLFLAVERIVRIHREQGEKAICNVCTALKIKMNHLDTDLDDVTSTNSSPSNEDDFFASMELGKSQVGELERYLSCPSPAGIDLLHTFPLIKNLSLKVNTVLPASAACERLFSHAGLLFTAKWS
ncbi:uncharacterized protein LOC113661272 [Tachysurus fulvidraco]|uniref:uncharacterized protein LOC125140082 n=1 Tax=Tachysurus fulvidraco TaxID=1234273 RepID=UPI001FEF2BE7|nr:uncharacterized protein LOC125140082 [Tachysurus fulvidraco]XP_047671167.1 uncharacterized protein LOC113661272 [Tachysurus fulvidraco]